MEPDPLPEPNASIHLEDTQITKKDIETILGVSKKRTKRKLLDFLRNKQKDSPYPKYD